MCGHGTEKISKHFNSIKIVSKYMSLLTKYMKIEFFFSPLFRGVEILILGNRSANFHIFSLNWILYPQHIYIYPEKPVLNVKEPFKKISVSDISESTNPTE